MIPEPDIVDASAPGDRVKAVSCREDCVGVEQRAPAHHLKREESDWSMAAYRPSDWQISSYLKTVAKSLSSENHSPGPGSLTCLCSSDNPRI